MGIKLMAGQLTFADNDNRQHWLNHSHIKEIFQEKGHLVVVMTGEFESCVEIPCASEVQAKVLFELTQYGWPEVERTRFYSQQPHKEDDIPF